MVDMERLLDDAATELAAQITNLLDLIDRAERAEQWKPRHMPCKTSNLDFLCYEHDGEMVPITIHTGRSRKTRAKLKARFRDHLRLCSICLDIDACYQWAVEEHNDIGIWGGTLPYERSDTE